MAILKFLHYLHTKVICRIINHIELSYFRSKLGYVDKTSIILKPLVCTCPSKVFLYENTNVYRGSLLIINPKGEKGNFIMKKNSGSAEGLTIVTGNHQREVGVFFKKNSANHTIDEDKDVVVEEDVWIGANVTLLAGVTVGRGATVGAGSVCFRSIPPYAIVMGNPAKVVGFNFNPEEVVNHEEILYPEGERLPLTLLEKNYNKYYLSRINEIKLFLKQ